MNILILDDQVERHELFEKYLSKDHILLHAFDVSEAINIVESFNSTIGLAMLDHDLGDYYFDDDGVQRERDGMTFVRSLLSDVDETKHPARFIIHSWNPQRAKVMQETLSSQGKFAEQRSFSGDMLKALQQNLTPN